MKHIPLAPLAVAGVLLLGAACSDDSDDRVAVESRAATQPADGTTTTGATGTDDGASDGGNDVSPQGSVPEDQDLDIEVRNSYGVTLKVSRMSFDGGDIFVDAEMINGSNNDISITTYDSGYQLRLMDDAGEKYNYVKAEGEQDSIDLAAGETVQGTLAFRGPLSGRPDRISLVMGVADEAFAGFDMDVDETVAATYSPEFVVPFDLTWA